jgi:hypothetical protein
MKVGRVPELEQWGRECHATLILPPPPYLPAIALKRLPLPLPWLLAERRGGGDDEIDGLKRVGLSTRNAVCVGVCLCMYSF